MDTLTTIAKVLNSIRWCPGLLCDKIRELLIILLHTSLPGDDDVSTFIIKKVPYL